MKKRTKGLIFVLIMTFFWALESIVSKIALEKGYDPEIFTYQSLLGGALLLLIYIMIFKKKSLSSIKSKDGILLLLIGLFGSGFSTLTTYYGLKLSTAVNYGFLIKLAMVFNVFFAYLFLKEKITSRKLLYILIILVSTYFYITEGKMMLPQLGDIFIIVSALCFATATAIGKPLLNRNYEPETIGFFRSLIGGLVILIFVLFVKPIPFIVPFPFLLTIRAVLQFLTVYFMYLALKETTVSYFTMVSAIFPVFMVISGLFIFNESIGLIKIISGLVILASIILIHKDKDI
jgi:drug/metabolite transporter (DMT)-like permease